MSSWWHLHKRRSLKTLVLAVVGAIVLTIAGGLIAINLTSGEKRIQHAVERLYSVEDPQFIHVMGVLLGPPVLGGNRYQVLLNGDQIFPSMLEAIRSRCKGRWQSLPPSETYGWRFLIRHLRGAGQDDEKS